MPRMACQRQTLAFVNYRFKRFNEIGIRLNGLKRHYLTVHETNKQFLCELCPESFGLLSLLTSHVKIVHENPKLLQCSTCSEIFTQTSSLGRHIRYQVIKRLSSLYNLTAK
jgi:hypothetical protein